MNKVKNSLSIQIKKEIGNRILFCSSIFIIIIFGLTTYDLSVSIDQLRSRINEKIKSIEDFTIGQVLIDNARTIDLKLSNFNESNSSFKIDWIASGNPKSNSIIWRPPFSWIYDYKLGNIGGYSFGYFRVTGSFLSDDVLIYDLIIRLILLVIFSLAIKIILNPLAKKIPEKLFIQPINRFIDLISNPSNDRLEVSQKLSIELEALESKILALLRNAKENERNKSAIELGQIASQVAHDIRSPLAVLNIETKRLSHIPEENRINIANAIQRVNDIANNFLCKYKLEKQDNIKIHSSELASAMLENIISEKRIQFSNRDIKLNLEINADAYDAFIDVDISSFKRSLSNIVNNAVDAIDKHGIVNIKQTKNLDKLSIIISDNGCGIPQDKLPFIFDEGFSYGKENGSGLGLSYSISKIFSWQGDYCITSEVGKGTTFEIIFPLTNNPEWFAREICIKKDDTIIILDDDEYIHEIWDNRFSIALGESDNINLQHFYEPSELVNFCKNRALEYTYFLLDYELIGYQENGISLAKMLGIETQSLLVTSRFEDIILRNTCIKLGMKIIPKIFAEHVPIKVISRGDIVFIDDEEIITSLWKMSALEAGKNINVFNDPRDFLRVLHFYEKDTPVYIDSSLGGHLKGEDFAQTLYEKGYKNLILSTGYPKEKFKNMHWILEVIGKEPPWN